MFTYRSLFLLTVVAGAVLTGPTLSHGQSSHPQRDPVLLDVLSRVITASGGPQALTFVRDVTESGEIMFCADEPVKVPVSIRLLGGHHFRMEADTPEGKRTWVVKNGVGSLTEADGQVHSISYENAVNLGNLTFPLSHFATALNDIRTDVSLVGIENREGRSIYRLRVRGELGLKERNTCPDIPVVKDLLIDAISFDILSVEDRPFATYEPNGRLSQNPSRTIEFGEFRTVNGIRVPFRITTRLMGQQTLSIQLTSVTFNNNLVDQDFDN
jgi:hypothetical protein